MVGSAAVNRVIMVRVHVLEYRFAPKGGTSAKLHKLRAASCPVGLVGLGCLVLSQKVIGSNPIRDIQGLLVSRDKSPERTVLNPILTGGPPAISGGTTFLHRLKAGRQPLKLFICGSNPSGGVLSRIV